MKKLIETALATASGTVDQSETADVLLARLAAVPRVRATLDEIERETALLARETPSATRDGNVTWAEIGKAFGITPEAAKYRFDGGNQRRKERDAAANEEPLVGESIATVADYLPQACGGWRLPAVPPRRDCLPGASRDPRRDRLTPLSKRPFRLERVLCCVLSDA